MKRVFSGLPLRQNTLARKPFSPAEPPVDDPGQPARVGKVKAGTRPAQPVGVGAFTLSTRAVSKSFDGRCSGGKDCEKRYSAVSPVVSPEGGHRPLFETCGSWWCRRSFAASFGVCGENVSLTVNGGFSAKWLGLVGLMLWGWLEYFGHVAQGLIAEKGGKIVILGCF